MAKFAVIISVMAVVLLGAANFSFAESIMSEGPYQIKLTTEDGSDLNDPIFGTTFYFDTFTDSDSIQYMLRAMVTIETTPTFLLITSTEGQFSVKVSISGLESTYFEDTGIRMTLESDDNTYHADLTKSNGFNNRFDNDFGSSASFSPNRSYRLSMTTIDGATLDEPPESVTDIKITFEATMDAGYHQVVFVSEGDTVDSYILPDNATITKVPSVSRSGYSFQGWFTPDGKEITDGYVISPDEGDIIAYAKWEADGSGGPNIIPITIGGVSLLLLATGFIIFFIKRRKEDNPPQ